MASITSGEMADCDWLRSTFSSPLRKIQHILKQNRKLNVVKLQFILSLISYMQMVFSGKEGIHWYFWLRSNV